MREQFAKEFQALVQTERLAQDNKWGPDKAHKFGKWYLILAEEMGELAKAILGDGNWLEELLQVAAVCQAIYEDQRHKTGVDCPEAIDG